MELDEKGNNQTTPLDLLGVVRVSNEDLAHGYGPAIQEAELTVDAPANRYVLFDTRIVVEQATIDLEERELFRQVLAEAIELKNLGRCDGLAFSRVDRLSRKFEVALEIALECRKHGLALRFVRENQWLRPDDEPIQFVMFVLHALSADTGTKITFKNTKEGQYRTARAGRLPGGLGPGILGYDLVGPRGEKHFEPNLKIGMVDKVLELAKGSASINQIVRELQARGFKVTRRTIQNILRHARVYAGEYRWGGIVIPGLVPPRITMADAERIESWRGRNKMASFGFGHSNWLSGRVRCAICGRSYLLSPSHNRARCTGCDHLAVSSPCSAPAIKFTDLQDAVWLSLLRNLLNSKSWEAKFAQAEAEYRQRRDKLRRECKDASAQYEKLHSMITRLSWQHAEGILTDEQLNQQCAKILPRFKLLQERWNQLKLACEHPESTPTIEEIKPIINRLSSLIDNPTDEGKKRIAEEFDVQVEVTPQQSGFAVKIFANVPLASPEVEVPSQPIVYQSSR